MMGKPPPERHSCSLTFMPKLGQVAIIGGRNDKCNKNPVLSDIWIINLSNLEYT